MKILPRPQIRSGPAAQPRAPLWRALAGAFGLAFAAAAQAAPSCPDDAEWIAQRVSEVRSQGAFCGGRGAFDKAGPVRWSPVLHDVAMQQATWIAQAGQLQHTGARGERVGQRALQNGYHYFRVGENLAHGQRSLDAALRDWVASDAHCATLFHPAYVEAAVACMQARDGRPLWVMILGRQAPITTAGLQQAGLQQVRYRPD